MEKTKQFYDLLIKTLKDYANLLGISKEELKQYFKKTDYSNNFIFLNENKLGLTPEENNGLNFLFAEICYHLQNYAHDEGSILNFKNNTILMKEVFKNFVPKDFKESLEENNILSQDKIKIIAKNTVDTIYKDKKKEINKQYEYIEKYLEHMYYFACKLSVKDYTRLKFIEELKASHEKEKFNGPIKLMQTIYNYKDYQEIYNSDLDDKKKETKYKNNVYKNRFALICDFIKECDNGTLFNDFCKPDTHIIDALKAYDNEKIDLYKKEFKCNKEIAYLKLMNEIVLDLNESYNIEITSYQLDRIIYLIFSGYFYLNDIKGIKTIVVNKIQEF